MGLPTAAIAAPTLLQIRPIWDGTPLAAQRVSVASEDQTRIVSPTVAMAHRVHVAPPVARARIARRLARAVSEAIIMRLRPLTADRYLIDPLDNAQQTRVWCDMS